MPDLKSRLVRCAEAWVAAQQDEAPLSRLGKRVMDDGRFFTRLDDSRSGPTTSTLERFARFLVEPENWPAGAVPVEICAFAHAVGITGPACVPSSDMVPPTIGGPVLVDAGTFTDPAAPNDRCPSGRTPPAPCDKAGGARQPAAAAAHPLAGDAAVAGDGLAEAAE